MNLHEYQRSRSVTDPGTRSLRFNILSFFSLETARPVEAKFHVDPPWDRGTKVCSNDSGHMINMAAMILSSSLETKRPMTLKIGMQHRALKYYQVYSNDDPGLTLTYFTARSNLVPYAFVREKGKTMDFSVKN